MINPTALSLEDLKKMEAGISARRAVNIRAELGKEVTPYNRANSTPPLDDRISEIASEIRDS